MVGFLLLVTPVSPDEAASLIASTGVTGQAMVVHVGCGEGRFTAALRTADNFLVHGLDVDADNVAQAPRNIQALGLYGPVSVDQLQGASLPYADGLVNLLIVGDGQSVLPQECQRVLAPGGVAVRPARRPVAEDGQAAAAEMDEWTHHLHDAGGNAVAHDTVVGPPQHLQWTAGPLWARSHGWTPSVSAMVSSGGRLFSIGDETLTGAGEAVPSKWFLVGPRRVQRRAALEVPIPAGVRRHQRHGRHRWRHQRRTVHHAHPCRQTSGGSRRHGLRHPRCRRRRCRHSMRRPAP